jgi:RHS repeat-associated protein
MGKTISTGFTGAYLDVVTSAYPLGNGYRWYLPSLMRFNFPDDLSPFDAGGINPYVYCAGDPINRSDPTGHMFNPARTLEETEEIARTTQSVTQTTDSLAASHASTSAGTSAGHELVPTGSSVPFAQSSASAAEKYVPVVEHFHPKYKATGTIMVKESQLKLGLPTLTSHYSDVPPAEVFGGAGGIKAPNPGNPDNTINFSNRMYHGGPNSPYVENYLPIPATASNYGVGAHFQYKYYTVSTPDDYAIGKIGAHGYGNERIVLRHGMIPAQDIVAVADKHAGYRLLPGPVFKNIYNVSIPSYLLPAIGDTLEVTRL